MLGQHALVVMSRMFSAQPGHPMLFPQEAANFFCFLSFYLLFILS